MKQAAAKTTTEEKKTDSPKTSPLDGMTIAVQMADTAWRVAVPIIVLTLIGARLDKHYNSKPAFTIAGLLLSLVISTILVYKQIKVAYPDFFGKGGKSS
jgi:F0F1-type ATP synthase assembly protein I